MAGVPAVSPVEQDLKNVLEVARNHTQVMAENLVQGQRGKNKCATGNPALVSNKKGPLVVAILLIPPPPAMSMTSIYLAVWSMEAGLLGRIDM